ncbi:serine hydrolase [Crocosphaera sp.]|uniref:serine hydrolase n=1 Tax=Crocosphaera sp. TaxID=2729996 RepID=UPI002627998D|nr:serine hydrolase [Crocosphaera sp.]MDJ0580990.1 serine hydrolase [Crocosphaera sp.]
MPRPTSPTTSPQAKKTSPRRVNDNQKQAHIVSGRGKNSTQKLSRAKTVTEPRKPRSNPSKRSPNPLTQLLLYILRIGIMGVGIGAIAGTTLTVINPEDILAAYTKASQLIKPSAEENKENKENKTEKTEKLTPKSSTTVPVSKELTALKEKIQKIDAEYPNVKPQAWFIDLDNGAYVTYNGTQPIPAASTIKIPVLVAFFEEVDKGNIHLDQMLTMTKDVMVSGSGDMQYMGVNKKFTALEVARKMIVISDNTATEMLVKQIGGKEVLNERFKKWGMKHTEINNILPDLEGTNKTSSEDLSKLLARIERGDLISARSRDRLISIMEGTRTRTLLPQGLEKKANIAHKTGDIGTIIGDAGIIDMPTGKRYIGAVFAERAYNDVAGRHLIQDISRTVYQHFKHYQPRPVPKPRQKPVETQTQPEETPNN